MQPQTHVLTVLLTALQKASQTHGDSQQKAEKQREEEEENGKSIHPSCDHMTILT